MLFGYSTATLAWIATASLLAFKPPFFAPKGVAIPVAVSAFPDEIYTAPRSWADRAYPGLVHYNRLGKGGHCAAWEQPELFAEELRVWFRSMRSPKA
jgi:pimeloyl-ACP methyl ester carboxylesterase